MNTLDLMQLQTIWALPHEGQKLACAIVEPRCHKHLKAVLNSVARIYGNRDVSLYIFHGTDNIDFVKNIVRTWHNTHLINMCVPNLQRSGSYSNLLTSIKFYKWFKASHVLIFQTDSVIRKEIDEIFFDFDYVGAPVAPYLGLITRDTLNGGFSLRRVSTFIEFLELFGEPREPGNEDMWWCSQFLGPKGRKLGIKMPSKEIANTFSVESIYYEDPVGMHQVYRFLSKYQIQNLLQVFNGSHITKKKNTRCILSWCFGIYSNEYLVSSIKRTNNDNNVDLILITNMPESDKQKYYRFKASALQRAYENGYEQVLWVDSSILFIRDIHLLWQQIETDGYWVSENLPCYGSAGHWTRDSSLSLLNITREESFNIKKVVATAFGLSFIHPIGKKMYDEFLFYEKNGAFNDVPGEISIHSCVKGHRHDQSALSVICHNNNVNLTKQPNVFLDLNDNNINGTDTTCMIAFRHIKMETKIQFVVVAHTRQIIENIKKHFSKDTYYLLVGPNHESSFYDGVYNIIVCCKLKYNIEKYNKLLTFTAWYAIIYNKLFPKATHIAIVEYDCLPSTKNSVSILEHEIQHNDVIAFSTASDFHYSDVDKDILINIATQMGFNTLTNNFFTKKSWITSSNTCVRKDLLASFVVLYWSQIDYLLSKTSKIEFYHERLYSAFLETIKENISFKCVDLFVHTQNRSHA